MDEAGTQSSGTRLRERKNIEQFLYRMNIQIVLKKAGKTNYYLGLYTINCVHTYETMMRFCCEKGRKLC